MGQAFWPDPLQRGAWATRRRLGMLLAMAKGADEAAERMELKYQFFLQRCIKHVRQVPLLC